MAERKATTRARKESHLAVIDMGLVEEYALKANSTDPSTVLDAIAAGNVKMPELDLYWYLFEKNPWVAACVNLIANTVAGDDFDIVAVDGKKSAEDVAKDPRIAEIREYFDNAPVGKMSWRRLMAATVQDIKIFGRGFWRKKRANKSKALFLERLDPRCVLPKPNKGKTEIEKFLVRNPRADTQGLLASIGEPLWKDAEQVAPADIVFFTIGGGDPLLGAPSPLEHLDHTLGLDLSIRKFRQSFFVNGCVTGKVIVMKGASRDQVREAENRLAQKKQGPANAFRDMIIAGDDVTIADKGSKSGENEIDFLKASELNRDEICAVYHVPPGKLLFSGAALGSSGKSEDDATFQEQCVLPLEETIFEIINRDIMEAELEIEDLELAPKRRATVRLDMFPYATQGVQVGMTGNESRAIANLPAITDGEYADAMNVPLFLGAKGMSIQSDMIPSDSQQTNTNGGGNVNETNDANDREAGGAGGRKQSAKGKARFRIRPWY